MLSPSTFVLLLFFSFSILEECFAKSNLSAFKSMNEPVKKIPSLERIPSLEKEAKCHVLYVGVGGIVCV